MEDHQSSRHDSEKGPLIDAAPDEYLSRKREDILEACKWKMTGALEGLAESKGGFIDDELRRQVWPILLGVSHDESLEEGDGASWEELPRHKDEDQVQLDVNRAFIYYPQSKSSCLRKTSTQRLTLSRSDGSSAGTVEVRALGPHHRRSAPAPVSLLLPRLP